MKKHAPVMKKDGVTFWINCLTSWVNP